MQTHVLSIGYGRHMFRKDDPERERLALCAHEVASLHMIVFASRAHALTKDPVNSSLTLYPTDSFFKIAMILDAVWLGLRILRAKPRGTRWCITTQDPFGAGVAGYILHWITRYPLVVQEHGDVFFGDYWRNESKANRLWYRIGIFMLRHADRVRAVSEGVQRHVQALGVRAERIVLLPVYTDVRAVVAKVPTVDLHAHYPNATCVVLSVARFVPQKNLLLLVRAYARLLVTHPSAQLVLVGKGPEEARIREECARLQIHHAVTILPWSDDIASLMKTADIYALSSNYEGWGRVLIEAMASGLPAVTTEVGCAGEVFLHDRHGLVVSVGDEKAFGDALVTLASDLELRKRLGQHGPEDAQVVFQDMPSYARKWAKAFWLEA